MNSSAGDAEVENFAAKIVLKPSRDLKGGMVNVKDLLRNARNSMRFTISERVQKGTELFAFYEVGEDESGEDDS